MKNSLSLLVIGSVVAVNPIVRAAQDVREGLVSYWPFETVNGDNTTPDLSFANHLQLNNLSSADLGTGTRGSAFSFNGTSQYLSTQHGTGNVDTGLPVYRAGNYTVMMWVKGAAQTARYLFTEASTTSNNPLFLLQTGQAAAKSNKLDVIVRTDSNTVLVNHVVSSTVVFDNAWHHIIAWVDNRGSAKLYVDGNLDPANFNYNYLDGAMSFNTTAVGVLVRAAVSGYFKGSIDEVAVWERVEPERGSGGYDQRHRYSHSSASARYLHPTGERDQKCRRLGDFLGRRQRNTAFRLSMVQEQPSHPGCHRPDLSRHQSHYEQFRRLLLGEHHERCGLDQQRQCHTDGAARSARRRGEWSDFILAI